MKTKLPILCFTLLAAGFLTEAQKKDSARPGGPGGGDDSPIEVAEGSHYVRMPGGLSINPADQLSADGNESGFYPYAFMLKGCVANNCTVLLNSNWQATLTDKAGVAMDEYCQDPQNMSSFLVHNLTGEKFSQISGGIKHSHKSKFDFFMVSSTNSTAASKGCPASVSPTKLACSGSGACKATVLYCKTGSTPPNNWSCK